MPLYPLKFTPRLFHKIWGGQHIKQWYSPQSDNFENVGESWLVSAQEKYLTQVANGHLAGNDLQELLEVYMSELVGDKVYEVFGNTFPVLVKFIDADDDLSIQVHPGDDYAFKNEDSLGKTEMWYVMNSEPYASVIRGWKQPMTERQIRIAIEEGNLSDYLNEYPVQEGDVIMLPAGIVHAMKRGTIVAEIQENSDITYRLYDYNRVGNDGKKRPLKLQQALDVLDYDLPKESAVLHIDYPANGVANIAQTPYFTTNVIRFSEPIQRDYAPLDSFVLYMCVGGSMQMYAPEAEETERTITLHKGEAVLLPACLNDIILTPTAPECRLLEVYMDTNLL